EPEVENEDWGARMAREQMRGLQHAPITVRTTSAITAAAWRASVDAELAAIIACTDSGRTARMISRFRPTCPILAMTPSIETARRLTMAWGIKPFLADVHGTTDAIVWYAVEEAAKRGFLQPGDLVGVLVGAPHVSDPTTDVLRLVRVG